MQWREVRLKVPNGRVELKMGDNLYASIVQDEDGTVWQYVSLHAGERVGRSFDECKEKWLQEMLDKLQANINKAREELKREEA